MFDVTFNSVFWLNLFSVTLIQIALGSDNLIIISILAGKLPGHQRKKAIIWGLVIAMCFRILLLSMVSLILKYATGIFYHLGMHLPMGTTIEGAVSGKAVILFIGGLFLIWKGVGELRHKSKGIVQELTAPPKFFNVLAIIVGMNLLFSVDSILTVVGMTNIFLVMVGSVVISVAIMVYFAGTISDYMTRNPDFEILGLFVLLLMGFVLILEGGHVAHLTVNHSSFPYIPQWIVIFILLLMFSVDLYQNWIERKLEQQPVSLRKKKNITLEGQ